MFKFNFAVLNPINHSQYVLWIWCFLFFRSVFLTFSQLWFLICSDLTVWKSCFAYYLGVCCESETFHVISSKSADCLNPCSMLFHVLSCPAYFLLLLVVKLQSTCFQYDKFLAIFLKDAAAEREIVWNRNSVLNKQTQQREDHSLTVELGVSDRAVSQTVAC